MNSNIPQELVIIAEKIKNQTATPQEAKVYFDYLNTLLADLNKSLE